MRKFLLSSLVAIFGFAAFAQYEVVEFDYETTVFSNGRPLPAETYFELRGPISPAVSMVEVQVYNQNGYPTRDPLYTKVWKRPIEGRAQRFVIPVNYYLRPNEEYDFVVLYFRPATEAEVQAFKKELYATLDAYLDQSLDFDKKQIRILKETGSMVKDMNEIVRSAMTYYRTRLDREFNGFSDLVEQGIEQVEESRQNRFLGRKTSEFENLARKEQMVENLKTRIHSEVSYLLNSGLQIMGDLRHVDNYRTEKTETVFTLHFGYGGAYFDAEQKQDHFGRAFLAGVTLPLGKKQFVSPFWSRTSLMFGVFFDNFELQDDVVATGPLIKRPYYFGMGYKFYRFLRLSVGATLLEDDGSVNGQAVDGSIYVRPFISLTADINLQIGLAK